MARPLVADRVKETTQTTGTGTLSLAGPASGYQSFVSAIGTGKSCYYAIVDDPTATTEWEVGIGTVTSGTPNTLSRDRVIKSSNSGAKVSWATGTKTVIVAIDSELLNSIVDTVDSDLVTAGTSTAYTLATNRPAVGLYEGRFICFRLNTTCGASPTINVDSSGAVGLVDLNGTAISSGAMVSGAYYWCKYKASTAKWMVFSPFGLGAAATQALGSDIVSDGTNLTKRWGVTGHTGSFSFAAGDTGKLHLGNTGTQTWTLLAAATAGANWNIGFQCNVDGVTFSSPSTDIVVNGSQSGVNSVTFNKGQGGFVTCNGTGYYVWGLTIRSAAVQGGHKNLKITTADGGTAPVITADAVTVENTLGLSMRLSNLSVTMDFTSTGAGKLDAGSIATSTWYYIWAIAKDDGTQSCLGSTSATSPTLPSGYTYKELIGSVRTKSGSAVFVGTIQYGRRAQYTGTPPNLGSGTAGSTTVPTWSAVAVANFIPTTAFRIFGHLSLPTSGTIGMAAPNNSYGAYNATSNRPPCSISLTGLAAGAASIPFDFVLESTNIYWAAAGANSELVCMGWEDNI